MDNTDINDWDEQGSEAEQGCMVGYFPHALGSDPEGCMECRDHAAGRE